MVSQGPSDLILRRFKGQRPQPGHLTHPVRTKVGGRVEGSVKDEEIMIREKFAKGQGFRTGWKVSQYRRGLGPSRCFYYSSISTFTQYTISLSASWKRKLELVCSFSRFSFIKYLSLWTNRDGNFDKGSTGTWFHSTSFGRNPNYGSFGSGWNWGEVTNQKGTFILMGRN